MKLTFIEDLQKHFMLVKNDEDALRMEQYMKYNFKFLGVKAHLRTQIVKYLYPDHVEEIRANLIDLVYELYDMQEREYQYVALELIKKNLDLLYKIEYVPFLRKLTELKPWWDTIDIFAKDILGKYLLKFPEMTDTLVNLMINSDNKWKVRSALLFQIHYKEKTNGELLFKVVRKFQHHPEQFVQNAINWSLNEYKKYNEVEVSKFIKKYNIQSYKTKPMRSIV